MTSIELLFDDELERAVVDEWHQLEAAGVPNQSRHTGATNRPHLTLIWADEGIPPAELPVGLAAKLPLEVRLGAPILFGAGKRGVILARLVVPTRELLELHSAVHTQHRAATGIAPKTLPGQWTPHVTLSRGVPLDQLADALSAIDPRAALTGHLVSARHWDARTSTVTSLA